MEILCVSLRGETRQVHLEEVHGLEDVPEQVRLKLHTVRVKPLELMMMSRDHLRQQLQLFNGSVAGAQNVQHPAQEEHTPRLLWQGGLHRGLQLHEKACDDYGLQAFC